MKSALQKEGREGDQLQLWVGGGIIQTLRLDVILVQKQGAASKLTCGQY